MQLSHQKAFKAELFYAKEFLQKNPLKENQERFPQRGFT